MTFWHPDHVTYGGKSALGRGELLRMGKEPLKATQGFESLPNRP
jgi:hypothetical protein